MRTGKKRQKPSSPFRRGHPTCEKQAREEVDRGPRSEKKTKIYQMGSDRATVPGKSEKVQKGNVFRDWSVEVELPGAHKIGGKKQIEHTLGTKKNKRSRPYSSTIQVGGKSLWGNIPESRKQTKRKEVENLECKSPNCH